jgi:large subunit ribosomal protein L25
MGLVKLNVYPRESKGKNENRRTRAAGMTPAVLYGTEREATSVQLDTVEFMRILKKTGGRSVIYDLNVEGDDDKPLALVKEMQVHPVTDVVFHVDLYEIPRGKPVEVAVAVVADGEPEAVKFGEAEVNLLTHSVVLRCLPRELPEEIRFDISDLKINDSIYVKDLQPGVGEIVDDPDTQILVIKPASVFGVDDEEEGEGDEAAGEAGDGDGADKD